MRKVVAGMFVSLDGVAEAPDQWQERLNTSDTILLGRVTYDYWHTYWPTSPHEPFASYINSTPKYVASNTLEKVEWGDRKNIQLIKGDVAAEVSKMKQQPGKNIAAEGSPSLVRYLLENGVLDELSLMIHPVVVGKGERLFRDGHGLIRLKLVDSQKTRSGVVIATYKAVKKT